jgi:hypothetical protein
MIDSNPELSNRMTKSLVDQIIGTKDNGRQTRPFMDILSEFEETAQRLGYKNDANWMGLVAAALQALPEVNVFLRTIMEQRGQAPQGQKFVMLQEDGSVVELSQEEYIKLLQSREAKKLDTTHIISSIETPPPPPAPTPTPTPPPKTAAEKQTEQPPPAVPAFDNEYPIKKESEPLTDSGHGALVSKARSAQAGAAYR